MEVEKRLCEATRQSGEAQDKSTKLGTKLRYKTKYNTKV